MARAKEAITLLATQSLLLVWVVIIFLEHSTWLVRPTERGVLQHLFVSVSKWLNATQQNLYISTCPVIAQRLWLLGKLILLLWSDQLWTQMDIWWNRPIQNIGDRASLWITLIQIGIHAGRHTETKTLTSCLLSSLINCIEAYAQLISGLLWEQGKLSYYLSKCAHVYFNLISRGNCKLITLSLWISPPKHEK